MASTPPAATGMDAELAGPDTAEEAWTRRSEARIGTIEARLREMETDARRLGTEERAAPRQSSPWTRRMRAR